VKDSTRRQFLRTGGVVGMVGLTGCSQITGGNDIKDTDDDGVIDSEDYAPRDPDVQDAEDVEESNPIEQDEGNQEQTSDDPEQTSMTVDGFEDGNIDEYTGEISGFEVQQSVVANGVNALKGDGDNTSIFRDVSLSQPSRVQGYGRVERGGGNENAHISYFNGGSSGSKILEINFFMNRGSDGYGDTSGEPKLVVNRTDVCDISYSTWYLVELEDINWGEERVGEVKVDGDVKAEDIDFHNSGSTIDTLRLKVNDWEDELGYFDDISIS